METEELKEKLSNAEFEGPVPTAGELKTIEAIKEGVIIGLKNAPSLIVASLLYILTIWIPYLNVGTTIAMLSLPVAMSKGKIISPLEIFDKKYRQNIGEFFLTCGFKGIGVAVGYAFLIIPGLVIAYAWYLAIYIFIDQNTTPEQSLQLSNKATYGHKWTIFWIKVLFGIAFSIVYGILVGIFNAIGVDILTAIVSIAVMVCMLPMMIGIDSVIYKKLVIK